jgi:hypothetical protein
MMGQLAWLALVALLSLLSMFQWRQGLFLLLLVGALQELVRKALPGAPFWITFSVMPIWMGIVFDAHIKGDLRWGEMGIRLPRLTGSLHWLGFTLVLPFLLIMIYSTTSWMAGIFGLLSVLLVFSGVILGYQYGRGATGPERWMQVYVWIVALMLTGTYLERILGNGALRGLLGSQAMGMDWYTHRMGMIAVHMLAGFYRSPDVMGWHAATMMMFCVLLSLFHVRRMRFGYIALAGWAAIAILMSGRRKMLAMVVVFLVVLLLRILRRSDIKLLFRAILFSLGALLIAGILLRRSGFRQDEVAFYFSFFGEALDRFYEHAIRRSIGAVRQYGFFGRGLGASYNGLRYLGIQVPRIWHEAGLGKMLGEIGVPGTLAVFGVAWAFAKEVRRILLGLRFYPHRFLYYGIWAILIGNLAQALVSAHIYSDPLVVLIMTLLVGMLLSGARVLPSPMYHPGQRRGGGGGNAEMQKY